MKYKFGYILIFLCFTANAQVLKKPILQNRAPRDSTNASFDNRKDFNKKNQDSISIKDYLIISFKNDTTYVDTSLTIKKDYKFNYLRRDEFGLIPFANVGQTYNSLTPRVDFTTIVPKFGARARHFNYIEKDDINYYQVPTPLTELFFKTVFEQGQVLDAFFTVNTSRQFNLSIAYKGMRSLGNYQNSLTSTGNLRMTSNYTSKNNRYALLAHVTFQDLLNEENGGLTEEGVANFSSGDEDFIDRAVFDPQFQNAESVLEGRRFYLNQSYKLFSPADTVSTSLNLISKISFEDKDFQFDQTNQNDFFGESFSSQIKDKVSLQYFESEFGLATSSAIGEFSAAIGYDTFNYGYDFATILNGQAIVNRINGDALSLNASYKNKIKRFDIQSNIKAILLGDFDGYVFDSQLSYNLNEDALLSFKFNIKSSAPNYNYLLTQSSYLNYNWYNLGEFENEIDTNFGLRFQSEKIANVTVGYRSIDNYSYFTRLPTEGVKPFQAINNVSYFDITLDKEITFGNFSLDNRILYQKVIEGEGVLNLPELVIRNSLYYSKNFFKNNALFLQTGFTFNYFTKYFGDAYDPLLAEFYTQNTTMIGNFPRLDFFLNAKVRQTRIFLKAEHLNAAITGYDYLSAPNYPYRDFNIRFGIVWNFFL